MADIVCVSLRLRTMFFAVFMIGISSVTPKILSSAVYDIYLDPKGNRINLNIGYDDWKTWIVMMMAYSIYGILFYAAFYTKERLLKIWLISHYIAMPLVLIIPLFIIEKMIKSSVLCTGELAMGFFIGYGLYVYLLFMIHEFYKHTCEKKAKQIKNAKVSLIASA